MASTSKWYKTAGPGHAPAEERQSAAPRTELERLIQRMQQLTTQAEDAFARVVAAADRHCDGAELAARLTDVIELLTERGTLAHQAQGLYKTVRANHRGEHQGRSDG